MFCSLTAIVIFVTVLSIVTPELIAGSLIAEEQEPIEVKTEIKKQPVVLEVEKNIEWYYFVASGYSANDPAQGTNSTTATGAKVQEGIVAVDPDMIPLGTEIEIKGMGIFVAEDTGGKIKGNRIDIYFDTKQEAKEFGQQGIWVKVNDSGIQIAQSYR